MQGFVDHNIEHLSVSSLNLWASAPALWVVERLLGHRSQPSALMARGKAVEEAVHRGLLDPAHPVDECAAHAVATFNREMALVPDHRRDRERVLIPHYVEHGLKELRHYGMPTAYQDRVEVSLDDVSVPLIGFIDWRFDQHRLIVDLKTSERLPSGISPSHARQGAVYARAHANFGMRFAYVKPTPDRSDGRAVVVYELERDEIARQTEALRQIAMRLGRFLAISNDPAELCGLIVPDYASFHWTNSTTRAIGAEVFGF